MAVTVLLILLWVVVACVADILFKNARGFTDIKFFGGLLLYMLTAMLAVLTFKRIEFGTVTIMWIAASLLIGLLVSVFYYHEKLTVTEVIAGGLTLVAASLVSLK